MSCKFIRRQFLLIAIKYQRLEKIKKINQPTNADTANADKQMFFANADTVKMSKSGIRISDSGGILINQSKVVRSVGCLPNPSADVFY